MAHIEHIDEIKTAAALPTAVTGVCDSRRAMTSESLAREIDVQYGSTAIARHATEVPERPMLQDRRG